jgi:DNA-binding SARP family transcriptional activator
VAAAQPLPTTFSNRRTKNTAREGEAGAIKGTVLEVPRPLEVWARDDISSELDEGPRVLSLGRWTVLPGGRQVASWSSRQSELLLKYLISADHYRRRVEETIEEFWPAAPPRRGREYFRRSVMHLRRTLEPGRSSYAAPRYVLSDRQCITLQMKLAAPADSAGIWLDAHEFEELTTKVLSGLQCNELLRDAANRALELYRGPFLIHDPEYGWAVRARDHYQRIWTVLVSGIARAETAQKNFDRAILLLGKLVDACPDDEDATHRLMVVYAATGRRGQALRLFDNLRRHLSESLDAAPGEVLTRLSAAVRAGDSMEQWLADSLAQRQM